jgi:hypothetical protein
VNVSGNDQDRYGRVTGEPSEELAWSIGTLPAGEYEIHARMEEYLTPLSASATLVTNGREASTITLTLVPETPISPRLVVESGAGTRPGYTDVQLFRITDDTPPGAAYAGDTSADGRNSLLAPAGRYVVSVFASGGWTARSAMVDGVDALDLPFAVTDKPVDIMITLTDRQTLIRGVVRRGSTATSAPTIVVFAENQQYWTAKSRRIRTARPRSDGVYEIAGLPAGSYLIVAVDDLPARGATGPAFLSTLIERSQQVKIEDGASIALDVVSP